MLKLRTIRLVLSFYKSYVIASSLISVSSAFILSSYGVNTLASLFWFKVITTTFIAFYINGYKRREFYYYQNLGISPSYLWTCSLMLDMVLFVALLILSTLF